VSAPYQLLIRGDFVVVGKEPDGDSVRFIANDISLYKQLHRSYRIQPTKSDGSVQLRFEGIDAPELHYGKLAQPLGVEARDDVLKAMGFKGVTYKDDGITAATSKPQSISGAILASMGEANGRPVSYVLVGDDVPHEADGTWIHVTARLVAASINAKMLENGASYLTLYTSTPQAHQEQLRDIATKAYNAGLGVWGYDASNEFVLDDQDSIGPNGELILPKLFRRCSDYLKARDEGFTGELTDWIRAHSSAPRNENDLVLMPGGTSPVHLSELLVQHNNKVSFTPPLLDITIVEK
jgi:endonuclease YncB( thermonuclease family)